MEIKVKICGMKIFRNIEKVIALKPDYIGFIFFEKSPRYIGDIDPELIKSLPLTTKRVGVFVNADHHTVVENIKLYDLDFVQLHGSESPAFCEEIQKICGVIKAFQVDENSTFSETQKYEPVCDYFLFDTRTPNHGGSGTKFDWEILDRYTGKRPFFLSGGIAADDAVNIKRIKHTMLYAVDLNSRFEIEPGNKNTELIADFLKELQTNNISLNI